MPLPLIEIGEAVAVGVLRQNIGFGNRKTEFLQPFVRHRGMEESVLQGRGLPIRADKMFFRHEKTGAPARSPLRRGLQLLRRFDDLRRLARRDFVISAPAHSAGLRIFRRNPRRLEK